MSFENLTKAALNPTPQDLARQARALAVEAWHKEYWTPTPTLTFGELEDLVEGTSKHQRPAEEHVKTEAPLPAQAICDFIDMVLTHGVEYPAEGETGADPAQYFSWCPLYRMRDTFEAAVALSPERFLHLVDDARMALEGNTESIFLKWKPGLEQLPMGAVQALEAVAAADDCYEILNDPESQRAFDRALERFLDDLRNGRLDDKE